MLNSITNAMHATALGIYTALVYRGLSAGDPNYTIWILYTFLVICVLKVLGIIVHLPFVENDPEMKWHKRFWFLIAIGFIVLNAVTLRSLEIHPLLMWLGIGITVLFIGLYLRSLATSRGYFGYIAGATVVVYAICAIFTDDIARIAWICTLLSNLAWIGMRESKYLLDNKYHNDIYHLFLIGSTYLLYKAVDSGKWMAWLQAQ